MTSILDDLDRTFLVVINDEGQHSLWPGSAPVPAGWQPVYGPGTRVSCLEYVDTNWTDMRPRSLLMHSADRPSGR